MKYVEKTYEQKKLQKIMFIWMCKILNIIPTIFFISL